MLLLSSILRIEIRCPSRETTFNMILLYLKQLAGHQFIVLIVGNGKDRLTDHFLQCELG